MFKRTEINIPARLFILAWATSYGALIIFLGYCVLVD